MIIHSHPRWHRNPVRLRAQSHATALVIDLTGAHVGVTSRTDGESTMLLALALATSMHLAPADSVTGKWQLKGDVVGNPLNSTCDFKQTGTTLSGNCVDAQGQPQPITGQVKDGTVTFTHGGDYQGTALTITYTGKLKTPTQIEGTIDVKPFSAEGTFTATPVPAK
jgi:hypothetical protein